MVLLGSTQLDLYALNVPAMPVLLKHYDSSLFFSLSSLWLVLQHKCIGLLKPCFRVAGQKGITEKAV